MNQVELEKPVNDDEHRIKRIAIDPRMLFHTHRTGEGWLVESGIPAGAQFRGIAHDYTRNVWFVFVEHPSFDVVPEGETCPELEVRMRKLL